MKAMIASVFPMFCSECSAPLGMGATSSDIGEPFPTHVPVWCNNPKCKDHGIDFKMPLPSIDCKRV